MPPCFLSFSLPPGIHYFPCKIDIFLKEKKIHQVSPLIGKLHVWYNVIQSSQGSASLQGTLKVNKPCLCGADSGIWNSSD